MDLTIKSAAIKTIATDTMIDGGNLINLSVGFVVNAGVEFTVQHLTIGNGSARRWGGGPPGPSFKPAIANNGGTLTVTDSTLAGNIGGAIVSGAGSATLSVNVI